MVISTSNLVEIITVVAKTRDTLFVRLVGQTDEK